ncbi:MAG TPA: sodium:solute symporter [Phycisphaerae bacterium]|nr:sodium:solute symporter [Phycisphaerae bacterium]
MEGSLHLVDWLVIAAYFLAVFGVVWWGERSNRHTRDTSAGYFLAGRNVGWFIIGASLFASNIGAEHLVGLAGAGASSGVVFGQYECQASAVLLILAWLFVPFYIRAGVYTMPEFLERRYGPAARWYLAIVSIIGYVLTKISVTIAAGGIVFEALGGVNFWTGAIIVVVATGAYTIIGGLRAVLYTDMFQMFVLVGGSAAVAVAGINALGGWNEMCRIAGPDMMSMWKPFADPNFPWTGVLFGAPIVAVWYWCTDQFIVQRVLSARNIHQARLGCIFAGYLKQLPLFLFVIPGVAAWCLAKSGRLTLESADHALPTLIGTLLPVGLRGLVMAGLLAALMSSLSSVFNSCSTLVTIDVYKKLRPQASERRLVLVGQISTAILVGLGLAWIPFMQLISGEIYQYLQSVQAYISPPVAAVFLIGVIWKRVNSKGAMVALITGFILGAVRLIAELNKSRLGDGLLLTYASINFMHMAVLLFAICSVLMIAVSLFTRPESESKLTGLTFATVDRSPEAAAASGSTPRQRTIQIWMSISVLAVLAAVWLYFSKL